MKEDVYMRKGSKSFYNWCIENKKEHYLDLWDYELNTYSPNDVSHVSKEQFYFKCSCGKHESFKKGINNLINSKDLICPQCNSFYQWCIDNNKEEYIKCWDYNKNKEDIHFIAKGSSKRCWFTIESYSYLICINNITLSNCNPIFKYYNSFGYYLLSNYGKDSIERLWSDKNNISPFEIDIGSGKKVWIKCDKKEYHDDYLITCYNFKYGERCPMCSSKIIHPKDSFAEFQKQRFGEDWVDKCWCEDNVLNPYAIPIYKNNPKVHIKCYNIKYHDFWITPSNYSTNSYGCPFCGNGKVHHQTHEQDSLGTKHPEILKIWSERNNQSPYFYAEKSHKKIWLKCENKKHDDYLKTISDYTASLSTECPQCVKERKDSSLQNKVNDYLCNTLGLTVLHEYDCHCVPINPITQKIMPFDNEVLELKLIIEVNGRQHYELSGWHTLRSEQLNKTPQEEFEYQQWKDNFKKEYALKQNYHYLAIPYWAEDNETYKQMILNAIKDII